MWSLASLDVDDIKQICQLGLGKNLRLQHDFNHISRVLRGNVKIFRCFWSYWGFDSGPLRLWMFSLDHIGQICQLGLGKDLGLLQHEFNLKGEWWNDSIFEVFFITFELWWRPLGSWMCGFFSLGVVEIGWSCSLSLRYNLVLPQHDSIHFSNILSKICLF